MSTAFLDPSRPLVSAVADWLAARAQPTPAGVAALDRFFVVVPTREAGRRLRVALARAFADRGGVIPPRIGLPGRLLAPAEPGALPTASDAECRAVLAKLLLELGRDECRDLLPPSVRAPRGERPDFAWALRQASALGRVLDTLAQAALLARDVPAALTAAGAPAAEDARWRDLALVEERLFARLRALGREHPSETRRRAVAAPARPEGVEAVVLPALPDAPPAFYAALARLAAGGLSVEVLVHADPARAADFDEWGRPRADPDSPWGDPARLRLPLADAQIVRRPDARAQAEAVADAWESASEDAADGAAPPVALGLADADLRPALLSAFLSRGIPLHDPSDRPLRETSLGRTADLLAALVGPDPDFSSLSAFLRETDARERLRREGRSHARALETLDELQRRHLPRSLADVRHFLDEELRFAAGLSAGGGVADPATPPSRRARFGAACEELAGLLADLDALLAPPEGAEPGGPAHLAAALSRLFEGRTLAEGDAADENLAAAADAVRAALRDAASPLLGRLLAPDERAALLRRLLAEASFPLDGAPDRVPLLGWLELPWCDEPRLVLAGMNEGSVPESVVGDAFLPDAVRRALGLPDNARRFARDAFLLSELLACRAPGAVRVFLEKIDGRGDARKPSRLLLACSDAELGPRVRRLYADLDRVPDVPRGGADAAWRLDLPLPDDEPPASLPVTTLAGYLASPFQWFLDRTLGDDETAGDPAAEIPANDFGTICHEALEALAAPGAPNESEDREEIFAFLEARVRARIHARYAGRNRGLVAAVRLQEAAALARMRTFAAIQAELVREGWRIRRAETLLKGVVEGVEITGKADRIDENVRTGEWRVVDYKTWDDKDRWAGALSRVPPPGLGGKPEDEGVRRVVVDAAAERPPEVYWADLQLPLYAIFARNDPALGIPGGARVSCLYLVLGDSPERSGLVGLEEPTPDGLEMAWLEAEAAVRRIRAGLFLPEGGLAGAELSDAARAILPEGRPELGIAPTWLDDQRKRRRAAEGGRP